MKRMPHVHRECGGLRTVHMRHALHQPRMAGKQ